MHLRAALMHLLARFAACHVLTGAAVVIAPIATSGCGDEAPPPDIPNLDYLVAAYAAPTAELDLEEAELQINKVLALQKLLHLAGGLRFVADLSELVKDGFGPDGLQVDSNADLKGHISVRRICSGADPDARDPDRDGTVNLEAYVEHSIFGPVVFGNAARCAFDTRDIPLPRWFPQNIPLPRRGRIDGPLAVHVGRIMLSQPIEIRPIVRITGTLTIDDYESAADFDFRLPGGRAIETRVTLPDATVAIAFADDGEFGIRERRGTWICSIAEIAKCLPTF